MENHRGVLNVMKERRKGNNRQLNRLHISSAESVFSNNVAANPVDYIYHVGGTF